MVIICKKLQALDSGVLFGSWNHDGFTIWTFSGPITASSFNVNELYDYACRMQGTLTIGGYWHHCGGGLILYYTKGRHGHSYPCHLFGCVEVVAILDFI